MNRSPQKQIESIVRSLDCVEATALGTSHPEAVSDLAIAVMKRFPKGGPFLDGAFSYLPQEKWPELVQIALDTLERSRGNNDAAASVIQYASFQCPSTLHPHLDRIFWIPPNAGYGCYPWRESEDQHFGFLRKVIENTDFPEEDRRRAWTALCETRHTKLIKYAISWVIAVFPSNWTCAEWLLARLHLVGFHQENQSLHRICPDSLYHLQFPEAFFEPEFRPPHLARIHPTWKLPESLQSVPFGGKGKGRCLLCGETLHRLLVLDPIPPGLRITRGKRLELATCLSCLGWERQPLFYRHTKNGSPVNIGYDGPSVKPQFPAGPLREAEIGLASTPRRWFWQDWAGSNGRENLNRVGGEPSWIQDAEFPNCP